MRSCNNHASHAIMVRTNQAIKSSPQNKTTKVKSIQHQNSQKFNPKFNYGDTKTTTTKISTTVLQNAEREKLVC